MVHMGSFNEQSPFVVHLIFSFQNVTKGTNLYFRIQQLIKFPNVLFTAN